MSTFERRNYADQLNIETPEQVELQFNVAGIGSRGVALLLDHLIQFAVILAFFFGLLFMLSGARGREAAAGGEEFNTAAKWGVAIVVLFFFCLIVGYFALFEAFWRGQTPGKRVMKLRVIKDSGRQITLFEALARNLLRFVDVLPNFYLVGAIVMVCNKRNKRLGDFAAGTLVIHDVREEQPLLYQTNLSLPLASQPSQFEFPGSGLQAVFPADAIAKLTPNDLQLIDTFFGRALDLSLEVRAGMAQRVANGLAAKMGVALPEGNPERALEAIAIQMRGSGRRF
ncbi:MAG TPA: RDD family protein [Acidobacteriaceae bacterium]|jgi:uncharacterized RDD family membrane protein YckC